MKSARDNLTIVLPALLATFAFLFPKMASKGCDFFFWVSSPVLLASETFPGPALVTPITDLVATDSQIENMVSDLLKMAPPTVFSYTYTYVVGKSSKSDSSNPKLFSFFCSESIYVMSVLNSSTIGLFRDPPWI